MDLAPSARLLLLAGSLALLPLGWLWLRQRKASPSTRLAALATLALFLTFDLIVFGSFTRLSDSGLGCPDWPGCYGRIVPPPQVHSIIEYTHRLAAALTTPLILASAAVSWWRTRRLRWVSWPLALVLPLLLAVVVFGALTVLTGLSRGWAAVDLGSALLVLALLVTAATVAWVRHDAPDRPARLAASSTTARLGLAALGAVFAVHVSGVLVAGAGSLTRCLGWPLWRVLPDDLSAGGQVARLVLSAVAGALIIALVIRARRAAGDRLLRRAATVLAAAFVFEVALIVALLTVGTSPYLLVVYVATATLTWAALVAVTVLACHGTPQNGR